MWLAPGRREGARAGVRAQKLAEALDRWPGVGATLRAGEVNPTSRPWGVRWAPLPFPSGGLMSATETRRTACTANILPVVLGGAGEVLDLGRSRRPFAPWQRKALAVRDRRCRAEDRDVPPAWCEAHHAGQPWIGGGMTDLRDGVLLCPFHHHRAHDHGGAATGSPMATSGSTGGREPRVRPVSRVGRREERWKGRAPRIETSQVAPHQRAPRRPRKAACVTGKSRTGAVEEVRVRLPR